MKKLIVISDWVNDSLTVQEFRTVVNGFLKNDDSNISFISSSSSTVHTGFLLNQVVETEEKYGKSLETVIFQNTDPRLDENSNKGAQFLILRLKSGLYVCGPNAGYDFSFIVKKIEESFIYKGIEQPSQFRSRDVFSRICAHLMDEMEDELDLDEISTNNILPLEKYYIGHIDNFGNIKTTIPLDTLKGKFELNDLVKVKINEVERNVKFVTNLFGGKPEELVIYPGSSGPKNNPYLEITKWSHFEEKSSTGAQAFNNPKPGIIIYF